METKAANINGHWHLRKEVTYGNIISTFLIVITLIIGWGKIQSQVAMFQNHLDSTAPHVDAEARLDTIEERIARIEVTDAATLKQFDSLQREIISRLDRIENRIDAHDSTKD